MCSILTQSGETKNGRFACDAQCDRWTDVLFSCSIQGREMSTPHLMNPPCQNTCAGEPPSFTLVFHPAGQKCNEKQCLGSGLF